LLIAGRLWLNSEASVFTGVGPRRSLSRIALRVGSEIAR
jgi:hypothetical protein